MDNIYGYVKWMGDRTFDEKEFNEIDAIVLCTLCYYELKREHFPSEKALTLRETYQIIRAEKNAPPVYTALSTGENDDLCEAAAMSARFGDVRVKNYTEALDHQNAVQFAAVTFEMPKHFNFIAFRGTDDTLAGWKEDFMISFTRTKAQEMALQYAQENIVADNVNMIGGHSKGANLALYAAAYLKFDQWDLVSKVYLLDGPGFCPEVLDVSEIEKVNRRAVRIIPEFSIIGMLFEPKIDDTHIVKSSGNGLLQHDPFTWGIEYGELIETDSLAEQAQKLNGLVDRWIENIDPNDRETFINELFGALATDGAKTISDIMEQGLDSLENIIMTLLSGSHTTRKAVASLPEQAMFGNAFSKIKEVGLIKWLRECHIAKDLVLFVIGLFFVLASDHALDITAMVFFVGLTVVELILIIRRLYQAHWKLSMVKERIYLLAALIGICIAIAVKDQALFMFGSLLYGVSALILAFIQLSKATENHDDIFMCIIRSVETGLLFVFGVVFLIINYDKIYGYSIFVGILLMVDGAVRIGYHIYRSSHPAKPRKRKNNRRNDRRSRSRSEDRHSSGERSRRDTTEERYDRNSRNDKSRTRARH